MKRLLATALLISALLGAILPGAVLAAAPTNDDFANATVISAFPYSDLVDNTEAAQQPGEPGSACSPVQHSVWYQFTATQDGAVFVDLVGSTFSDGVVNLYRSDAPGLGGLTWLHCTQFGGVATAGVAAGTTYFIQAGDVFGAGGTLGLHARIEPAPANDDFAGAAVISSLPYSANYDLTPASREPGEPVSGCAGTSPTVWYTYQPQADGTLTASVSDFGSNIAIYTGSGLDALTLVDCAAFRVSTFDVLDSETYYFQVGGQFGQARFGTFSLVVTPPPDLTIFGPSDPSTLEATQFFASTFDSGGIGVETVTWDFGDGSTGVGFSVSHFYARDGDYVVTGTATTFDGRTRVATQAVSVRTHDVAITKFAVPNSASVGQTRSITVGISNRRYPEQVSLTLFKLTATGTMPIGTSSQTVPVRTGNRTTDFTFSYTFSSDDARIGKVSFFAIASLTTARDASIGDNQAQSLPTKVNK